MDWPVWSLLETPGIYGVVSKTILTQNRRKWEKSRRRFEEQNDVEVNRQTLRTQISTTNLAQKPTNK